MYIFTFFIFIVFLFNNFYLCIILLLHLTTCNIYFCRIKLNYLNKKLLFIYLSVTGVRGEKGHGQKRISLKTHLMNTTKRVYTQP